MTQLFVEQITVIDCAVLDRLRGLVGQSWLADVTLEGDIDDQGMILDFGPAKRLLKQAIDARVDHKLLVPAAAPGLELNAEDNRLHFTDDTGVRISHSGPGEAVCMLQAAEAGRETVAAMLQEELSDLLPANVHGLGLTLRDEVIDGAEYAYCHGLKKHAGHCQRIAHGHRSRLRIYVDGERSSRHESRWADRWQNVYLGTRADLATPADTHRYRFAYEAAEGPFELELDASRCALLETDSTVENIAAHIAETLKAEEPHHSFTVQAYEGVNKGAIASA